ncbi:MAG: UTP--glucose-1-phosphate uridylyltransferase [Sphingomicrobium sp.]
MSKRVRKAVFPVAGLGTRLLPATKSVPKEMITIVDRPLIQYAVDEAREAGIEQMIFVTSRGKSSLDDYFDVAFELEATMREKGKSLDALGPSRGGFGEVVAVRQQQPLGLGHAVWCARDIVGDEPFAVLLPDDLMVPGALKAMVEAWDKVGGNLIATEQVPQEKTQAYGIITPGETHGDLTEVLGLVEKPKPADAPSRLGVIGRYILQPEVMRVLDSGEKGAGGEIQLTDALARLIGQQPFHALKVDSVRYDCGDKAGFVVANLALALGRDDVGPQVREFIRGL